MTNQRTEWGAQKSSPFTLKEENMDFIQTRIGMEIAQLTEHLLSKILSEKQYTVYTEDCGVHAVIEKNIKNGSSFVSLFSEGGYTTVIFKGKKE